MTELVRDICQWAIGERCLPLAADLAPGTTAQERRSLAALGGLVRSVAGGVSTDWPEAVQHWARDAPSPPAALVSAVRRHARLGDLGIDVFADAYEGLIAGPNRRKLGTFFTPPSVVDLMLERAASVLPSPRHIVDPGAGVGAFSIAARRRWPRAIVTAVDVNVVTLGLLAARAHMERASERLVLAHGDYLQWIRDGDCRRPGPTLLLGNPPYTRHQELDQKLKSVARDAAGDLVDSGLAGLAAYFLGASLRSLGDDDALCFVLPGSWTESRYGRPLRNWVWEQSNRHVELLPFPTSTEVFPGTRVTAMVLVVGPTTSAARPLHIERITAKAAARGQQVRTHDREGAASPRSFGPLLWRRRPGRSSSILLSEIARVRRGVATGANHFFFLGDEDIEGLPSDVVLPAVRRLRHVVGNELDRDEHDRIGREGLPRWLLSLRGRDDARHPAVRKRLADGIAANYDDRYLARVRDPWYVIERIDPPHLLVAFMTKDRFRGVNNTVQAIPSNSIYGIYLNDPAQASPLRDWINSDEGQDALRVQARHYSNGLFKLEPRDYMQVRVPNELST